MVFLVSITMTSHAQLIAPRLAIGKLSIDSGFDIVAFIRVNMPAKGVPPIRIVNVVGLRIVFYHHMIDNRMKAAPTMAFLARADAPRARVNITGIPAWTVGVMFGVAPVTFIGKITLEFHVMKVLGCVEGLSILIKAYKLIPRIVVVIGTRMSRVARRECLFPMAVLTRIRVGCNKTWTILGSRF